MRGVNSPLFTEGALIRDPRAVPNLCKADSGLSAMFGILAAISSHLFISESLGTCPRLCTSARNVDCAVSFPLLYRLNRHAYACHFFGPILNSGLKILIPTKTTRKAATNRFVVSPCVLGYIEGSYAGFFGDSTSTTSFLNLKSKLHLSFTNFTASGTLVPLPLLENLTLFRPLVKFRSLGRGGTARAYEKGLLSE